jgi:hypothetical protein
MLSGRDSHIPNGLSTIPVALTDVKRQFDGNWLPTAKVALPSPAGPARIATAHPPARLLDAAPFRRTRTNFTVHTLAHYDQRAEEFRASTRSHDVSQNIAALLRHIHGHPPFDDSRLRLRPRA